MQFRLLHGAGHDHVDVDVELQKELERAAETLYGPYDDGPAGTHPQLASSTGFHVGFAVCWLLLQTINGRETR